MFSHRIHGIHRTDWQRVSSHRFHGIHRIDWQRMFSHRILGIHRTDWQRVSSHRIHGIDLQRDVLPQISQIYTDGACLEFCEFCVFCGTSHAPSESVKICAICGRIVLVAWGLPSYRIDWQRVSSHRIHRIHRSFACVFFPRNSQNSQKFRLRVLPTEFTEFTEVSLACSSHGIHRIHRSFACVFSHGIHRIHRSLACVFFPRNSQILTDGVCLEFCEFREFCGTSHALSESVKICAICGRIILPVCSVNSVNSVGPPTLSVNL